MARRSPRRSSCWLCSAESSLSLLHGAWPALLALQARLPHPRDLEPGHRRIRRAGGGLRHDRDLDHRHAARAADQLWHRGVPDGARAFVAQAADRRRDRAAGRDTQHHLRLLGAFRPRPGAAGARGALDHQQPRGAARSRRALSRRTVRHRGDDRRHRAGDHDRPVHRRRDARCVRDGSRRVEGVCLRTGSHDLGGDLAGRRALFAHRHGRRHDARPRAGSRRDHGGDFRDRQCAPDLQARCSIRGRRSPPPSPTSSRRRPPSSIPPR